MSQQKNISFIMENNFEEIWARIKGETDLKSLQNLGDLIQRTQPTISGAKAKNEFPPGWAYQVGRKYGLLTEWIMTGEGPKRINEIEGDEFFSELQIWAKEMSGSENINWLKNQIISHFPGFKEWKKRKEESEEERSDSLSSKVA